MSSIACFIFVLVAWLFGIITKVFVDRNNAVGTIRNAYANNEEYLYLEFDSETQMNKLKNKKQVTLRVNISRK